MALVALEPATRESRLAAASARWAALLAVRPDLEPAVALQRQLIGLVVDLAETVERSRLPRLSLPPRYLAAKLARGVPVLAGEPIPLPVAALKPVLVRLCEELAAGGAGEAADHIKTAIVETRMDAGSLLTASLARDQAAIRTGRQPSRSAADLLWLVAELAVSPFAYALQRALLSAEPQAFRASRRYGGHARRRPGGVDPRLLPGLRLLAGARRSRGEPPRPALLVLRVRLGAADLRVRLLRRSRRAVRHRRAGRRQEGSAPRSLRRVRCLPENRRRRRAVAVSAPRHRRSRDDGSRHGGDGTRLRARLKDFR